MAKGWPEHLFLVGCGNMAGQMLNRWLDCGLDPSRVTVLRPSGGSVADGVDVVTTYPQALAHGTTVMLGMKPYQVADVAAQLAPLCHAEVSMLSILAGTTLGDLRARFPATGDIVRAMPNLPVGMGQGVVALYTDAHTSPSGRANMEALLGPLGLSEWMADEALFNRVGLWTGLSLPLCRRAVASRGGDRYSSRSGCADGDGDSAGRGQYGGGGAGDAGDIGRSGGEPRRDDA